ncbi:hypothetical protein [uncultured Martelella sp.]|uniref:hypothetical protein n=1 Tax=uncultured Martelella sp. TaxID=392331 RepID=UPI0029C953E0|nr:hypothetical protein [uncultured Martelella sp.]
MNNFFNTPEDNSKDTVVTKYLPREWNDEYAPLPQADPNAFLKSRDGKWFLVPTEGDLEDAGSFCIAVSHGDLIDFDSKRDYGSSAIKVAEDGSYTLSEPFPEDATHFAYDDADDLCNTLQEVIADGLKNDPEAFTPPLETTVSAWFWGDATTFRVVIEEGAARLDRLPEPPLVLPYTNWRGETAIRRIRPIGVKFTSTSWHREPQWILEAYDYDRQEMRGFAMKDFRPESFQKRVDPWMQACFGAEISADRLERGDRLIEEVLELLQAVGYPRERITSLMEYTWSRPPGEPAQEVGGTMVTLAAFCLAHGLDMHENGETELARVWTKVEQIRAKQAAKPTGSALPQAWPTGEPGNG